MSRRKSTGNEGADGVLANNRVAETFAPVNSVAVLVEASRGATPSETTPVVLADAGVENVNAQVDDLN